MSKKQALVLSGISPLNARAGNAARMASIIESLCQRGYQVTYVHLAPPRNESATHPQSIDIVQLPRTFLGRTLRAVICGVRWLSMRFGKGKPESIYTWHWELVDPMWWSAIRRRFAQREFDVLIGAYPWTCVLFSAIRAQRSFCDTNDVFTDRNRRMAEAGVPTKWIQLRKAAERNYLQHAGEIIAIQDQDQSFFRALLADRVIVHSLGHLGSPRPLPLPSKSLCLGFLGSENAVNQSALQWLIQYLMPLLDELKVRLCLAGQISCSPLARAAAATCARVELMGVCESVNEFYSKVHLTINPCVTGTGLKIKNVESMMAGRGVITSTHGAIGLEPYVDQSVFLVDDQRQLRQVLENMKAPEVIHNQSHKVLKAANDYHQHIQCRLTEILE